MQNPAVNRSRRHPPVEAAERSCRGASRVSGEREAGLWLTSLTAIPLAVRADLPVRRPDAVVCLVSQAVLQPLRNLPDFLHWDGPEPIGVRPHPTGVVGHLQPKSPLIRRVIRGTVENRMIEKKDASRLHLGLNHPVQLLRR